MKCIKLEFVPFSAKEAQNPATSADQSIDARQLLMTSQAAQHSADADVFVVVHHLKFDNPQLLSCEGSFFVGLGRGGASSLLPLFTFTSAAHARFHLGVEHVGEVDFKFA